MLSTRLAGLCSALIDEAGDEEDVVNSGEQSEPEDCRVDRRQVITCPYAHLCCQHHNGDGDYLYNGANLPGQRGLKGTETRNHIDGRGAHQNENVATEDRNGDPERDWQVARNRRRIDAL